MRYLLSSENQNEVKLRQEFLYDVFKIWFIRTSETDNFITLQAFPFNYEKDIIVLYGHNEDVKEYLYSHRTEINEQNVFIISCSLSDNRNFVLSDKRTYLSLNTKSFALLLNGKEYGFDFDITECELNLYNSPLLQPINKLKSSFTRIKKGKKS